LVYYTDNFSIGQEICQCVFLSVMLAVGFHLFDDVIGAVHDVMANCLRDTTTITETGFVPTYLMQVCIQATSAKS